MSYRASPVPYGAPPSREDPALPCPECRSNGHGGMARIGNRRNKCLTCNKWAATLQRLTWKDLVVAHPEEYADRRRVREADLYPQIQEEWALNHPQVGDAP